MISGGKTRKTYTYDSTFSREGPPAVEILYADGDRAGIPQDCQPVIQGTAETATLDLHFNQGFLG